MSSPLSRAVRAVALAAAGAMTAGLVLAAVVIDVLRRRHDGCTEAGPGPVCPTGRAYLGPTLACVAATFVVCLALVLLVRRRRGAGRDPEAGAEPSPGGDPAAAD